MVQIIAGGSLNNTSLVVPDLYVQIQQPQVVALNGVPSDVLGLVGSASWGPVNQPVVFGNTSQYAALFGPIRARKYDMGTQAATAAAQGAQAFVGVRATDGTDIAASYALLYSAGPPAGYPLLLTALHTGTLGNSIALAFSAGSTPGTWKMVFQLPGTLPEAFDNIPTTGGNAAFWAALVTAINNGQSALRGPSALVVATLGSLTTVAPSQVLAQSLLGGLDGASGITAATLVGADGLSRTGMYGLRGQGCAVTVLADADDSTQWGVQSAFALSEGMYVVACGPAGDTISNAPTIKAAAGINSYGLKLMFGDWLYWFDQTNQQTRLVSPQGFVAGELVSLSPEQSSLNKQLSGIIGSQKSGLATSGQATAYSAAELQVLGSAGIDVICNPAPGGAYWAVRFGHNSATGNAGITGDSYTRMTNFIASTLASGMGLYVGAVINADLLTAVRTTLLSFLGALLTEKILGSVDGSIPYSVICDGTNNPPTRTALGFVQADCAVRYQGINEKFIVNLQGGAGVTITQQPTSV